MEQVQENARRPADLDGNLVASMAAPRCAEPGDLRATMHVAARLPTPNSA
jgi:hypothetical protein